MKKLSAILQKEKQVNHWQKPERNVYYQYLD